MYNSRYLMYEVPRGSKLAEYGEVVQVLSNSLFNVAMGGMTGNVLQYVSAQNGYTPKLGDWVTVSWINGQPIGIGGSASYGLNNINDNVVVTSQSDIASGTINTDHIRVNAITADQISANSVTAEAISANTIQAYHLTASSVTADAISANSVTTEKIASQSITSDKIASNSITTNLISANSISSDKIQAQAIQAYHLSANSVTTDAISANSIRSDQIITDSIQSYHITANAIESFHISSNQILAYHIGVSQVETQHISSNSITADKMAVNSIDTQNIIAGSITADLITANAITSRQISANSILSYMISADQIQSQHISANTIDSNMIQAEAIGTNQITANAITSNLINSNAIQSRHISSNVILSNMISANQVQTQHISANSINSNLIQSNAILSKHISSNVILSNMISANQINASHISANQVQTQHISSNTINSNMINSNQILANHISSNQIQTQHISANTVTGQQIKANTITAQNISAGTITGQLISANTITGQNISGGTITADLLDVGARQVGLLGQYYSYSSNSTNKFQYYKGSQIDPTINFDWGTGSPILAGQSDYFSVRWQGYLYSPESGTFNFKAIADNSVTVTVNNSTVINQSSYVSGGTTGSIQLAQGNWYPILVEYSTTTGNANMQLYWETPSSVGAYEIVPSVNFSQGSTVIDGSQISTGSIQATAIAVGTITASSGVLADASIQTANIADGVITSAKIGKGEIQTANIASGNITNALIADATIQNAKIANVDASKITTGYISASRIDAGTITGTMIAGQTISGGNIMADTVDSINIKSSAITADKLSAGSVTADAIEAGAVTAQAIQAGAIESQHISTVGLDAQVVSVYNGATGQTLIDGGYLNVGGLDVGVVQSDNLIANGMFLTASSSYGYARNNPTGNILLGSSTGLVGANQLWKYDLTSGNLVNTIDIPAQQPYDVVIHPSGNYAYVTAQGNNTLVQIDIVNDAVTNNALQMGTGPARAKFVGLLLDDDKHIFALNSDNSGTMLPDSLSIIDTPPNSVDAELYVHHQVELGMNPIDLLVDGDGYTWITLGTQGEIVKIDTSNFDSMNWKVQGRIPISAFGTDNYHGGLPSYYGLQEVTGGDASGQYNADSSGMSGVMSGMDAPSGYGSSDGSLKTYAPHGIEQSSDSNTLYVLDNANGELVVVDKNGQAPYNGLIGSGPPNSNQSSKTIISNDGLSGGTGSTGDGNPAMFKSNGEQAGGGPTTFWVRYRIPVGDSPEFMKLVDGKLFITLNGGDAVAVIDESAIINEINADNSYYGPLVNNQDSYQNWNIFKPMREVNTIPVRTISNVGAKPFIINENGGLLYVSLGGQNQIAVIDPTTETVTKYYNTGANPKGFDFTPDGKYMYVANFGGQSDLSFVYPQGSYIGDAFLGLEGGVEYQGADHWVPNRSDWVYDSSGNVQSQSTVQFRINEPFLNEGGYVILNAVGQDYQYAQIEQDITEVTNYSNGNNTKVVNNEIINASDSGNTTFKPKMDWVQNPAPHDIMVATPLSGNYLLTSANASQYTINYGIGNSSIVFSGGVVPSGGYVEVSYTGMFDVNFQDFNGSVLIANENGSSTNFQTLFEIDEYVPNFVVYDNRQTSSFTPTEDGINDTYTGLEYSIMTNRALNTPSGNISYSGNGGLLAGYSNTNLLTDGDYSSGNNYFGMHSGNSYVELDLGMAYMVGQVGVWHYWDDGRTYYGTKTEVSEDGSNWITVFDSAVSGTYAETSSGNVITFDALPVRYVRDWLSGNTVNSDNHWKEIKVFGDWEVVYDGVYPNNSTLAGQQIATNGKSYVSTDISGAYVAVDIQINFTTWWYMTYIVGPDYGKLKVDMPTLMSSSHFLELESPYINKVAHRHLMSYPPSAMIMANDMMGIKAGKHRARIVQVSGRITFDRFRFEDYQFYQKNSLLVPSDTSATIFRRQKIIPSQAKWYVGKGTQTTEGAYDSPRVNDQGQPDYSVPIKYRFRVKAELNANGTNQERGIAYATSMIFEQGQAYTSWRMSNASDIFPGNKIEVWDSNLPFKTGIQNAHIADGAITGLKIMPNGIMDYHINNYARIQEHKLELNYPTHQHGYQVGRNFVSNLDFLDEMYGWAGTSGNYGTGNTVSRGDHWHPLASSTNDGFMSSLDYTHLQDLVAQSSGNSNVTDTPTSGSTLAISSDWAYTHSNTFGIGSHVPTGGTSQTFLRGDGTWQQVSANGGSTIYLTSVSGNGNSTVTFTRQGASNITWDASHTHSQYIANNASNQNVMTGFTMAGTAYVGASSTSGSLIIRNSSGQNGIQLAGDNASQLTNVGSYIASNGNANFNGTVSVNNLTITSSSQVNNLNASFVGGVAQGSLAKNQSVYEIGGIGVYTGCNVSAQSTPNMSVLVNAGTVYTNTGMRITLSSETVALSTASNTYGRIDVIYVQGSSAGANEGKVTVATGTPASSPVVPSIPSDAVQLAQISVPQNIGSIQNSQITDTRVWRNANYNPTTDFLNLNQTNLNIVGSIHGVVTFNNPIKNSGSNTSLTFNAGTNSVTWTHNLNLSNYTARLSCNSPEPHVYWSNKTSNAITINLDDTYSDTIIVDVSLEAY